MRIWKKLILAMVATALLPISQPSALADSAVRYPAKPVRIVTGPSGSGTDVFARPIAQRMHEVWGQPVVVENRALGSISAAVAAKAASDGYTLLVGDRTWQAVAQSLYKELPYDPAKDFAAIAQIASTPMLFVAHPSVPATNLGEFIAYAKRLPQPLGYATAGIGTANHLPGEQLKQLTGIDLTAVHYKGGGAAMVAMLGGEVKVGFNLVIQALPHVKTGRVKAYVITAKKRFPGAADIPTVIEAGFPDLEADYMTRDNLLQGGAPFVGDFLNLGVLRGLRRSGKGKQHESDRRHQGTSQHRKPPAGLEPKFGPDRRPLPGNQTAQAAHSPRGPHRDLRGALGPRRHPSRPEKNG